MGSATVHLDLSELVANPLRSGIQRVEREAIRHWSGPATLVPCRVNVDGRLLRLPTAVLEILCAEDDGSPEAREAERSALRRLAAAGEPVADSEIDRLLNLELFYGEARADAHLRIAGSGVHVLWFLYDFLPFLQPELFPSGTTRHCMHFLRALRGVGGRLAFLSRRTRDDYATRVARAPLRGGWPVLDPGADALGLEKQKFSSSRHDFVSIGTIEPRKNTGALLRAFDVLWQRGADARLVLAGRLSPEASEARAFLNRRAGDPRLVFLDQPADATLRRALRGARAMVMPSEAEGFGLPPYEALHAGIPSVASAHLPSAALMPAGVLLMERMEAGAIAAAVESLLDDAVAARLWAAAAAVRLPSWADFGRALADWAQDA